MKTKVRARGARGAGAQSFGPQPPRPQAGRRPLARPARSANAAHQTHTLTPPPPPTPPPHPQAHFFPDLNLSTILEPADPNDKLQSCTKVGGQPPPPRGIVPRATAHPRCRPASRPRAWNAPRAAGG
jgi:hypothetical protein